MILVSVAMGRHGLGPGRSTWVLAQYQCLADSAVIKCNVQTESINLHHESGFVSQGRLPKTRKMAPEAAQPLLANADRHVDTGALSYGTDAPAPAAAETVDVEPRDTQGTFQRNLGTLDAFAIIISIVIGSGIFTSPGSIDTNVPSPGLALVIWLVGGMLAWTGASTMAELGTAIPGEGTSRNFAIVRRSVLI